MQDRGRDDVVRVAGALEDRAGLDGMEDERSLVRAAPLARVALAGELDCGLRQRQVIPEAEALRVGCFPPRMKCAAIGRDPVTGV